MVSRLKGFLNFGAQQEGQGGGEGIFLHTDSSPFKANCPEEPASWGRNGISSQNGGWEGPSVDDSSGAQGLELAKTSDGGEEISQAMKSGRAAKYPMEVSERIRFCNCRRIWRKNDCHRDSEERKLSQG